MSVSSMTGFARLEGAHGDWTWAVEARSVNGRGLEVRFRGPPGFDSLERAAREAAQGRLQRGQVGVSLQARRPEGALALRIDEAAIARYLSLGADLVASGRAAPPSLDGLLALPGVARIAEADSDAEAREALEAAMAATLAGAMEALDKARRQEGRALAAVMQRQLDQIETLTAAAREEAQSQPQLIKARFERRLIELAGEAATEERIVQEAAAQAVRADVQEELDRLSGHVEAARGLLAQSGAVGRKLDFLTQEFMREANTMTSKSASAALTAIGLDLKAVIDQFREQAQNVE
ncbi:MAG TPA: YicC/YloC family endoribonuclease [Caulobacteraceae bacterium]|jgi:uncharacterized protein (TIGR00255 family)|nr:YicC/YloC family endoribonuclease [Caulobacteraceae bacterium]